MLQAYLENVLQVYEQIKIIYFSPIIHEDKQYGLEVKLDCEYQVQESLT